MKKKLFYTTILVSFLITVSGYAQDSEPWNKDTWDCENIELPYSFCTPDGITEMCVKDPHNTTDAQGRKLKPIVRKIGNCVPNFDEGSLANKDNITRNGKKIFDITKAKQDILDAYNEWKKLYKQGCGITEASGQDDCCPEVTFSSNVRDFFDKNDPYGRSQSEQAASTYAITTFSYDRYVKSNYTEKKDAGGRDVCEAICTSPVKIYLNKTAEFNLKSDGFYTQYFYTGKTAPNRNDIPGSDETMSLYEIMMHEFGHYFGLTHTGDGADCNSMGSGKTNQMLMASPRAGFGTIPTRVITRTNYNANDKSPNPFQVIPNRDKCYFCKLYCPDKGCASVNEKSGLSIINNSSVSPNPFKSSTTIHFEVLKSSRVKVTIFDGLGNLVDNVINEELEVGNYKLRYNIGENISSGVYYYKIESSGSIKVGKLNIIK